VKRETRDERRETWRRRVAVCAVAVSMFSGRALVAQQKVPLVLEHLVITLDSATFHDVRSAPLFRRMFSSIDSARGGLDLFGKYNWLTLVGPESNAKTLIRLADERSGRLDQLQAMFERGPGTLRHDNVTQWRDHVSFSVIESELSGAWFGAMQFDSASASRAAVRDSLPADNRTLVRFLAPYFDRTRLLSALTGATLAIPVDDIKRISRVLERDSVTVVAEGEGAIIRLDGFTLHLIPSFVGAGVKQLQFALTQTAVGNPIYQFGPKSQLKFGPGAIAVWNFNWP
jgi:hypothetical protein